MHGYNGSATPAQPYKAEDIVIVSDLICLMLVILLTFLALRWSVLIDLYAFHGIDAS